MAVCEATKTTGGIRLKPPIVGLEKASMPQWSQESNINDHSGFVVGHPFQSLEHRDGSNLGSVPISPCQPDIQGNHISQALI